MPSKSFIIFLLSIVLSLFLSVNSFAGINMEEYGWAQHPDEKIIETKTRRSLDSLYQHTFFFQVEETQYAVSKSRPWLNKTTDFYMLLGLVLFLGVIRFIDPKYPGELWAAFLNTGFSGRTLRDKIEQSTIPNVLMNVFFVFVFGSYLFYVFRSPAFGLRTASVNPLLIMTLMGGVALVYIVKYFVIRFSGWAFDLKGVTDTYLFNVFLVNKILAIALFPFTVVMAFQDRSWSSVAVVLSFILIVALLISRYVKSWQVLGSFFHYSKFHFFTYLCASEIMPLAVLTKFLLAHTF